MQGENGRGFASRWSDLAAVEGTAEFVVDLRLSEDRQLVAVDGPPSADADAVFVRPDEGLLGATGLQKAIKRTVDILLALLSLLILWPLLLIAALAIKATSSGPVFFAQDRVGKDGDRFRFLKFRTMYVGAEDDRDQLLEFDEADGPVFKIREDPRLTRSGRILRRLSVDEIPQLIHVISGRMSLVGPRPPLPAEVDSYGDWERQRLLVKPGITGIWQTSGRSDLDFQTWMAMDVEYIQAWSLFLDWKLLARTIPAVLSGRGAY